MANFNFTKVIIGGRLTADPELATTPSGVSVCSFAVAVNRRGAKEAVDFFTIKAWRQTAEFVTRYFRKGSSICIVGSLQTRTWVDQKTGGSRYVVEIVADEAFFVDAKAEMPRGQVVVTEDSEAMQAGQCPETGGGPTEAGPQGKPVPGVYSTPDARAGIREGMAEGDEDLPF